MRALWNRELNDTEPVLTASLADASNDGHFTVAGVPIVPDTFTLGASISAQVRERVFVHADYKAEAVAQRSRPAIHRCRVFVLVAGQERASRVQRPP